MICHALMTIYCNTSHHIGTPADNSYWLCRPFDRLKARGFNLVFMPPNS